MQVTLFILLISLLIAVVIQDFKNKAISWFLIPLLFVGFSIKALLTIEVEEFISYSLINLLLVSINLLGVTILISMKEKKMTNILNTHLGLGDVLFFVVLTVVFSPINFVLFYLLSIATTAIIYGGIMWLNAPKEKMLIPLAGAMSIPLISLLFIEQFTTYFQLYEELFLIHE